MIRENETAIEKPNYFSIIPADVRYNSNLKPNAKLLYGEITALSNKEGYCFANNNYFTKLYNCSVRAIENYLKELQDEGYIKIFIENNFQRKIFLTTALCFTHNNIPLKNFLNKGKTIAPVPSWLDEDIKSEDMSPEEVKEFEELLKEFH